MNKNDLIKIKNQNFENIKDRLDTSKNAFVLLCKSGDLKQIDDYISADGYFALEKTLCTMSQDDVVQTILQSGLRGRGGAGFPTGKKWQIAKQVDAKQKYIICNCDEGDPGAFMDRAIAESYPHAILEAMAIAGYAIGANKGMIYVRAEYPKAVENLTYAIEQAKQYGLLGKNIFSSNFDFDIQIKLGAGAFVCGEETALIKSCEGFRGEPATKPPYPANKGYDDCPTVINNIETLANVPRIINKGIEWFKSVGAPNNFGTKVFALSGKITKSGLVEAPLGTTIRQLVYDFGGGIPNDKEFKAVQMGGPSGGCIPKKYIDTPIDYESLKDLGAMMGSGGVIVMDEDTCMVDIAKFFLHFSVDESCGKCTPCRLGNKKLLDILEKICNGKANSADLKQLEELAHYVKENSLCGLGQSSPNPILSTLRYFQDEYLSHVDGHCRTGVCKNLVTYVIDKSKCVGCSLCARNCPVNAIFGHPRTPYEIDQRMCIKCGKCSQCRFGAVKRG